MEEGAEAETPEDEVQRLMMVPSHVFEKRRDEDAEEVVAEVGECHMNDVTSQDEVDEEAEDVVHNVDMRALDNNSEVEIGRAHV